MKFAVAILAVLAVAVPLNAYKLPSSGSGALAKELQDLVDLIPFDKIVAIAKAYAAEDKEFQVAMKVLQSDELKLFVVDVEAIPEAKNLLKYIQKAGLDITHLINKMNDILGIGHISSLEASEYKISGGINGFVKDVTAVVPVVKLTAMVNQKWKNSKVFNDFVHECTKPENVKIYRTLHLNKHYVKLTQEFQQSGIKSENFPRDLFGLAMTKFILAVHKA